MLPVVDSIAAVRAEDDGDYIPGPPPVGDVNDGDGVEDGDDWQVDLYFSYRDGLET